MDGIDAQDYVNMIKKRFRNEEDQEEFFAKHVYFKNF